jgi:hypothetical protein
MGDPMRQYRESDLEDIGAWYVAHGLKAPPRELLPANGLVVPGVAAGFLYSTDSGLGLLEGFVTNPAASARARAEAVDAIADELEAVAGRLKMTQLIALVSSKGVERLAKRRGWKLAGNYPLVTQEVG